MKRTWIITTLALAGAAPLVLEAQQPAPPPAPAPRARTRTPRPEGRAYTFSFDSKRGRIGVLVNTVSDSASDRYGARIDAVTPGGPAEKAGLKAGDIITRFNGTSLARSASTDVDEDESAPGHRLVELAHDLDPGDTVKIEYRRGAETKNATLVADEGSFAMAFGPNMREMEMPKMPLIMGDGEGDGDGMHFGFGQGMGMGMGFCMGDAWCDLDLVTLNSDLGDYFGTKEGVLVIKASDDSTLPLKSGDVILSIGGRKPTSPSHAMRILRSYDAGETVSIEIMRHQRRSTLSWTVPAEERRGGWRVRSPRPKGEQSMWVMPDRTEELRAAERALLDARGDQLKSLRQSQELLQNRLRTLRDNLRREQIQTRELRRVPRTVVI